VVNQIQFERARALLASAEQEGAIVVTGGLGLPAGVDTGYFIAPTVVAQVTPDMRIAREEIFAPIVSLIAYDTVDEAIEIANDTPYGLAAYVQGDATAASEAAARLRVGQVEINTPPWDSCAPFGGFKQSGNGRECGEAGFEAYLEVKAVIRP
jgi:aldehyde dehydrogenase (NAD+)